MIYSKRKMIAHRLCHFIMLLALLLQLVSAAAATSGRRSTIGGKNNHQQTTRRQRRQRHLIVGGHDAVKGRYPYFVSLDYHNGVVLNGALIAPDFVLTAGHCLENDNQSVTVRVGTYSLSRDIDDGGGGTQKNGTSSDGDSGAAVDVVQIGAPILHPDFDQFQPEFFRHDFLLFHLRNASHHPVVKINRDANIPAPHQDDIVMMGLGWTTTAYQSPADTLQVANLTALSNDDCRQSHDPARNLSYADGLIDGTMLCTVAPPDNARDGCAWDSGAPLIVPHGDDPENDVLVGLGSWGIGCADPFFPGVQARVSSAADWIDATVCELSVDPPKDFECHKKRRTEAPTTPAPAPAVTTLPPTVAPLPAPKTAPPLPAPMAPPPLPVPVAVTASPTISSNATTPPTRPATEKPEESLVGVPAKPVRGTLVFVPTSVLLSCVAVIAGVAVLVYLGMNWYYRDRRHGGTQQTRRLVPKDEGESATTTAYGSTDDDDT